MGGQGRGLAALSVEAAPEALRPATVAGRRRLSLAWLGTLPFFAYLSLFLFVPAAKVMIGAFKGEHGGWSLATLGQIVHQHQYRHAYWLSIQISLVTAVLGGLFGLLMAYAALREGTPRWIRSILTTFSGVAANFAGIPLAAAFIATLGTIGIATAFLRDQLHIDLYGPKIGFSLFTVTGLEVVYLYFQIPLMILVIAPAIDGLRSEWREAASNLGARSWQYWWHVGIPILTPSFLGAFILLFGNSFSAYATAYSLTGGGVGVVPVIIGYYYTGNVLSNPHLSQALALGMFVVLAATMLLYVPLTRRAARWQR